MATKKYTIYGDDEAMEGPYTLDDQTLDLIDDDSYGVYLLISEGSGGHEIVRYVGRGNLRDRLTKHMNERDCSHFYAKILRSEVTGFKEECRLFHKYGKRPNLDNRIHPPRPTGRTDLPSCSEDGCNGEPD